MSIMRRGKSPCGRAVSGLVSLVMFGAVGYVLWHMLGRPDPQEIKDAIGNFDFGDFTDVLDDLPLDQFVDSFNEDPYVGDNTTDAWETNGNGLTLELQNALDDNWQTEFQLAVSDWQESDALTLTTKQVEVDHSCQQVPGVMKVCNGNFGETGWLGINEVLIEYRSQNGPGYIVSSVAKMNEYYLLNADYEERQYTMCHEIGHGFGLPHTDENPHNADLGNCLDYTTRPENNLHPDETNFHRLASIYLKDYQTAENQNVYNGQENNNFEQYEDEPHNEDGPGKRLLGEQGRVRRILKTRYLYV